ncbi:MAG: DUF2147 domain-containing protein [Bacteroidales bacterium]|nr:DUF2147 domain-containing protein [Bacteroidales bacterium]
MKKFFLIITLIGAFISTSMAQNALNNKAESIIGTYSGKQGDDLFKAKISQQKDGTFSAQVIWVEHDRDTNGNKLLDTKNPDKNLRNTPCDQIVLFSGLRYNAKEKCWDGTKIYDPQRGIKAKLQVEFTDDGQLKLRGSILGIGESVYWKKI